MSHKILICVFLIFSLGFAITGCGRHKLTSDEINRNRAFSEILQREDSRTLGHDDFLPRMLRQSPYPEVRLWAATAMGRIGDPAALPWLYEAFASPLAEVRAAAAFAVGEIEDRATLAQDGLPADPAAIARLTELINDSSLEVRIRATEAIGKAGSPPDAEVIHHLLASAGSDPHPRTIAFYNAAITALMRLKSPSSLPLLESLAISSEPEIQWRAVNALVRTGTKGALPVFLRLINSPYPEVQAYAAQGIGICEDASAAKALFPLVSLEKSGTDKKNPLAVRFHAVRSLGMLKPVGASREIESAVAAALSAWSDPDNVNFAIAAAAALGNIGSMESERILRRLLEKGGPAAGGAAIALAKVSRQSPDRFFAAVNLERFAEPAGLRSYIQALGELGGSEAVAALRGLLSQNIEAPNGSAGYLALPTTIAALARAHDPDFPAILRTFLTSHDGVVLRAALEAYQPDPKDKRPWETLLQAYAGIAKTDDAETKVSLLIRLESWLQEPDVISALRGILQDRNRNACIAAARLLRKSGDQEASNLQCRSEARLPTTVYSTIAGARKDRSVAIIETSRGRIEIDLFREEAPITVANFESLALKHYFDNLQFMRVVPFFVVQTGDPRNDQEGGPGYSIRCEINRRPYERGSIGMALAGKDTGGSQFFIAISPQPHLDGGYTCFGRVISGMQIVDSLVPGDRILRITIEEDISSLDYRRY